jgi:hypothetical protein
VEWELVRETEVLGENLPLCRFATINPDKTDLTWDRIRFAVVGSRWLTTWARAQCRLSRCAGAKVRSVTIKSGAVVAVGLWDWGRAKYSTKAPEQTIGSVQSLPQLLRSNQLRIPLRSARAMLRPFTHEPSCSTKSKSKSKLCYDQRSVGQSVLVSSTHLRPKIRFLILSVAGLLMWGALSDERTGLSFAVTAGPRQRNHSRVRVPRDSWPYFTVSDSRLPPSLYPPGTGWPSYTPRHWVPFSSPRSTRRDTEELFEPASTRGLVCRFAWARFNSEGKM